MFLGDLGQTSEYFDVQEIRAVDIRSFEGEQRALLIFEMSEESILTTV
jgi:hypothetical protein